MRWEDSPEGKEYYKKYRREYYLKNRELLLQKCKKYQDKNREKRNAYGRRWSLKKKKIVLAHYGTGRPVCVECGFKDIRALSLDHINNDGAEQRRKHGMNTQQFYGWLIRNNFPLGYQTLCMNCQWIKRHL